MGITEGGNMAILAGVGPMGLGAIDYALHCNRKPGLLAVTDIDQARLDRAQSIHTIEEAKKHNPNLIALSALMTTTAIEMEKVIKELRKNNINIPVIVGGAVITEDYADSIRAEYSKDALSAVKKINELIR